MKMTPPHRVQPARRRPRLGVIERSNSYGVYDDALVSANDRLKPKCQQG